MARSEQSTRAREIFESALDIASAEERAAYVKSACGGDSALLERVQALLQADHVADSFLPNEPQASRVIASIEEKPGTVIGRYKLLEKIGEGGMGVVYMAQQEEPVRRKVALKIIKLGMDTRQVVTRFEAERQALALMDHPNIAKVFDGGVTEPTHAASNLPAPEISQQPGHPLPSSDEERGHGEERHSSTTCHSPLATHYGRPYFVMELVQGVPITEFCDKNQLSTEERIKLFILVCQAIQSAHQKGIIHRDLKPSNVLVTLHDGVPVPKVIDFGVAKAINQKLTEKTLFTNFATMIGTPAYMSPEQAEMSGLDIDTRSDIYSLGVLLYELLTGTTPFPEQRLRSVAYSEMQRIIVEEEPERPSTRLRRTSLAASPGRLAPRPSSLATDLDWIVMKCLEKDRARRYDTANGFAADIQRHLDNEPVVARPPSTAYRFKKLVRRNRLLFSASAMVVLALVAAVAVSSWQAVRATRAERTAREEMANAARERQGAKEQAEIATKQAEIARSVKDFLAEHLLGSANPFVNPEPDPAKRALLERVNQTVDGKFPNQPLIEADIRFALGRAYSGVSDYPNAAAQLEKALEIRQRLLGAEDSDTLETTAELAISYLRTGRMNQAETLLVDATAAARRSPQGLSLGGAWVLYSQGYFLLKVDRPAEGLPYLKEALGSLKRTMDPKDYRVKFVSWMLTFATQRAGDWKKAEALWADGVRECERDYPPQHLITAQFLGGQGILFVELGRAKEAVDVLERCVATDQRTMGTNHSETLDAECWLGRAYETAGRIEDAVKLFRNLHPRWAKHFPFNTARIQCHDIAEFFVRHRRYDDAMTVYGALRESLQIHPPERAREFNVLIAVTGATKGWPAAAEVCRKKFGLFPDSPSVWRTKGTVLLWVGDGEAYQDAAAKALALAPTANGWKDRIAILETASRGTNVLSLDRAKQCDSLIESLERALAALTPDEQARGQRTIAAVQLRLGQPTEGLEHLEKAVGAKPQVEDYSWRKQDRGSVLVLKALCLQRLGRVEEARAAFAEGETILNPLLPEPLDQYEGFLDEGQLTYLILRREARALLAGAQPKL